MGVIDQRDSHSRLISLDSVSLEIPVSGATLRRFGSAFAPSDRFAAAEGRARTLFRGLRDISFSVSSSERVAILGRNGAGKSLLLRCIAGIYTPSKGRVLVRGEISALLDVSLGILHENTGRENLLLRGALMGVPLKTIKKNLDAVAEFSGLGEFLDQPVRTYSSGMQLRLGFAVSTLLRREVLLLDEWMSVGDRDFREKAHEKLLEMTQEAHCLVLASHSRETVEKVCNRGIILDEGTITFDGDIRDATEKYFGAS